jgi:hypothetical protein
MEMTPSRSVGRKAATQCDSPSLKGDPQICISINRYCFKQIVAFKIFYTTLTNL